MNDDLPLLSFLSSPNLKSHCSIGRPVEELAIDDFHWVESYVMEQVL